MHVRRRFHAALKLGDKRAAVPMSLFKRIYKIEKKARGMSPEERLALRQKESIPLLEQLYQWIDAHVNRVGKSGKLAEAIHYALNQKEFVWRCFSDGRFEIDNGAVERAIRKPAVGRKNFLFTGSADAARRLASAYTLVLTCRELGISTAGRAAAPQLGDRSRPTRRSCVAASLRSRCWRLARGAGRYTNSASLCGGSR